MAVVIDDVKIQMGSWFSESEVQACRRQANKLTHEMEKVGAFRNANCARQCTGASFPYLSSTQHFVIKLQAFSRKS
jgi:hypothetical protein